VKRSSLLLACILLLAGLLCFYKLGAYPVVGSDARYAAIAREMLDSGDLMTPRLRGIKHLDKPPFAYWVTALGYRLFGYNEFGARFFLGVFALATCAVVAWFAWTLWGPAAAAAAVFCLATALGFLGTFHVLTTDGFLVFFNTVALCAFYLWYRFGGRAGRVLFFASLGISLVVKGPVGLLTVLAIVVAFLAVGRKLRVLARLGWAWGLALVIVLGAPWFVLMCVRNPGLLRYFVVEQLLLRVHEPTAAHPHPWWFFLLYAPLFVFPWAFIIVPALHDAFRSFRRGADDSGLFLASWLLVPVVVFSIPPSKLPLYIAGIVPAAALLCARWMVRVSEPRRADSHVSVWFAVHAVSLLAAAVLIIAALTTDVLPAKAAAVTTDAGLKLPLALGAGVCIAGAIVLALLVARGRFGWCFALAPVPLLAVLALGSPYVERLPWDSVKPLAEEINRRAADDDVIATFYCSADGLGFYTGRRVVEVPPARDVRFEEDDSYRSFLVSAEDFTALWHSDTRIWCVMHPYDAASLSGEAFPVTEYLDYALVTNKPLP